MINLFSKFFFIDSIRVNFSFIIFWIIIVFILGGGFKLMSFYRVDCWVVKIVMLIVVM